MTGNTARIVRCPRCGAPVEWSPASRWRPFCSERCKLVDLGDWAAERYRVPAGEVDDSEDDRTDADREPPRG